jgi:hypothetical protein
MLEAAAPFAEEALAETISMPKITMAWISPRLNDSTPRTFPES